MNHMAFIFEGDKMNLDRLKTLCSCCGVSSNEQDIAEIMKPAFEENADQIVRDNLGSIFAYKKSKRENAKTFMIACPMDECGMMVSKVNDNGTLTFITLEDIAVSSLLHQRVTILCRDHSMITGVITNRKNVLEGGIEAKSIHDLVIDCGYTDKADLKVLPGDLVSYASNFFVENNIVYAKALNPRVLNEVCMEVVENLKEHELDFNLAIGAMSQSTIGFRGTKTATYTIQPDAALALCVFDNGKPNAKLNGGVVVGMYDKGMIPSQRLINDFKGFTSANGYFGMIGNDSSFIHKTVKGCPTVAVGIACGNTGSANEMVAINDIDALVHTLTDYILHLNNEMITDFGFGEHHV